MLIEIASILFPWSESRPEQSNSFGGNKRQHFRGSLADGITGLSEFHNSHLGGGSHQQMVPRQKWWQEGRSAMMVAMGSF
jgi:hypothetical protein